MRFRKKFIGLILIVLLPVVFLSGCVIEKKDPSQMHVAMITDAGDITDQSYNQQVYEACMDYCEKNHIDFTYKKPEKPTAADRVAMVDLAVAEGYNTIVCMGNDFSKAVSVFTKKYPDIKFISADIEARDILEKAVGEKYLEHPENYRLEDYCYTDNLYIANYSSEVSGFLAGYAAVKSGYRHLGFLGGQAVPGVVAFGYGYLQGIEAAVQTLGIANEVSVDYAYAGQYFGSAEISAAMDTWYSEDTQIVFACGGGIYTSVAESAVKYGGKVIGVDTDQSAVIDRYQKGLTFTSAMKRLDVTVNTLLDAVKNGHWDDYKGKIETVGLVSATDQTKNAVGLPMDTTRWNDNFTREDYNAIIQQILSGEITISSSTTQKPSVSFHLKERPGTIM